MEVEATPSWLSRWMQGGVPCSEALRLFDGLEGLSPAEMVGRWTGRTLPTGHPLDGLLEALGWYGKDVLTPERVHPLLFRTGSGRVVPLEPRLMPTLLALRLPGLARSGPMRLALSMARPMLRARRPGARLELRTLRGLSSTALVYQAQPIADHLRRVDRDRVVGLMEHPRMEAPFFFLLTRGGAS